MIAPFVSDNEPEKAFLSRMSVLLVEEDEDIRERLCRFIRPRVGGLVTANNGYSGLETFLAQRTDVVVTEILFQGMDGLTMAQEIRRADPHVRIVVMTVLEDISHLWRAIDVGVDQFVTKSGDPESLYSAMLQLARDMQAEELEKARSGQMRQSGTLHAMAVMAGGAGRGFRRFQRTITGRLARVVMGCAAARNPRCRNAECAQKAEDFIPRS